MLHADARVAESWGSVAGARLRRRRRRDAVLDVEPAEPVESSAALRGSARWVLGEAGRVGNEVCAGKERDGGRDRSGARAVD